MPEILIILRLCHRSIVVSQLCRPDEVHPVALRNREHVERVLALDFVCLPVPSENVVAGRLYELLSGEVGHAMLVLYIKKEVPTGSMIFLMSKWCL